MKENPKWRLRRALLMFFSANHSDAGGHDLSVTVRQHDGGRGYPFSAVRRCLRVGRMVFLAVLLFVASLLGYRRWLVRHNGTTMRSHTSSSAPLSSSPGATLIASGRSAQHERGPDRHGAATVGLSLQGEELSFVEGFVTTDRASEGDWQALPIPSEAANRKGYLYVYRAYWDTRMAEPSVRIIGMAPLNRTGPLAALDDLKCRLKTATGDGEEGQTIVDTPAVTERLPEHHNKTYAAHFLFCGGSPAVRAPTEVELFFDLPSSSRIEMPVRILYPLSGSEATPGSSPRELSVCVRPWWGVPKTLTRHPPATGETPDASPSAMEVYDDADALTEFVELWRLLGARFFTFYESAVPVSGAVVRLLEHYVREGLLEVVPYRLPSAVLPFYEVWDFAQNALVQDCYLRRMDSRYLALVDTDEFILPSDNATVSPGLPPPPLPALLDSIRAQEVNAGNGAVGAFRFYTYFFFTEWPTDGLSSQFATQRFTRRTELAGLIGKPKSRTKCIIMPR
ncbi:unnamed protein product [Vitrella brassicaformis CCMP3155]|uniref:Glycosyltransferase family 92 protein n=1 Tax=Vitrella brassicaformis (strain CCMP3155) TaxID=1169540 RepID=A0A0G4EDJ0_VITBC|nr:unnamed protein product [Vitrella brassicaformis CCMP3155]|eukprot:CEL93426.1 unnamed protein product [Vitrella brassicaformis CCMP3155]